jgi:hypothetical protein
MSTDSDQIIRDVLGRMAADAPDPLDYEHLGAIRARPAPQGSRLKVAIGAVAAVSLAIVVGNVSSAETAAEPSSDQSLLLVPTWLPDGLYLAEGEVFNANGATTSNLDEAAGTQLEYLTVGADSWVGGDQVVVVGTNDVLATTAATLEQAEIICTNHADTKACRTQLSESACWGLAAIETGELDPAACRQAITDAKTQTLGENALLNSAETTVRDKPAFVLVLEVPTDEDFVEESTQVYVFEGGGIISSVVVYGFDRDTALDVAESLNEENAEHYAERTS